MLLVFAVLFWMYGGYAWLTNQLPPTDAPKRLLLIGGMAGFLVCALAVPDAFGATGLAFGFGYLIVVLLHAGLYAYGQGRAVWRFAPFNIAGALCLIAAAFTDGAVQYGLWVAPIVLQLVASRLASSVDDSSRAGYDVRPGHFVERHGLLLLIAFGESVIAIGVGVSGEGLTMPDVVGAILALGLIAALWWTFFGGDQERAEAALWAAPVTARVRMALGAYFYAFIPLLLGVIVLAAGLHLALGDLGARLSGVEALLLGGGVALFLAGDLAYRVALGIGPLVPRAVAAVAALGSIALGVSISALGQVVALLVILDRPARGRVESATATAHPRACGIMTGAQGGATC